MKKEVLEQELLRIGQVLSHLDGMYEKGEEAIYNGKYYSDSDYDRLYFKYLSLIREKENLGLDLELNYDPNNIHFKPVESLKKDKHEIPVLSLDKINDREGILKFIGGVNYLEGIMVEEKLDGLTIVAHYNDGKFIKAITRGNGYIGEDVSHSYRMFRNVPKTIDYKGRLVVRMEALITHDDFMEINKDGRYSNARNLASGSVRQLDPYDVYSKRIKAIAFEIVDSDKEFETGEDSLSFLKDQSFDVVGSRVFKKDEDLLDYILSFEEKLRSSIPYMIDGLVLKTNSMKERDLLGYTSKGPRWAVAYKFEAEEASTRLKDVVYQVGKTGQITPVAVLEGVEIGGVFIQRATLHNYRNIKDKDIRIGDELVLVRANDVIPQIVKPIKSLRDGGEREIRPVEKCPSCNSPVEVDGENLYCVGLNCEPQQQRKIIHYASRDAMNIVGLGEKTVEDFYKHGVIKNILDIYSLKDKKEEVCSIPGYGEKTFDKIVESIEDSKKLPFERSLYALSINFVGRSLSKTVADMFGSMRNMIDESKDKKAFEAKLKSFKGIGDSVVNSLLDFLSNEGNIRLIEDLLKEGVSMIQDEDKEPAGVKLEGLNFVVTGKVNEFKNRKEIEEFIKNNGGSVKGSVSSNTDYLLNNDINSNSSKNKMAKKLNVAIISELELLNMINS